MEIKYISAQNVVAHTENCKLELLLDCSVTQVEKNIRRMCGIDESSGCRGFADFVLKVFYIDFIEGGISEKHPLCLELKKELEMFQRASCTSLSVKVIQRQVMFQKGSVRPVNIVFKQKSPSVPETEAPRSCTSSGKQLPQEKIVNKSTDSGSDKQENLPKTLLRLKELLLQTNDTRQSKDGKRIECLQRGKSPKLDDCKRTAAGHLKYFRRVHNCNLPKANEQPKKINEYFEPTEKRQKNFASDDGSEQSCLFQTSGPLLENIT